MWPNHEAEAVVAELKGQVASYALDLGHGDGRRTLLELYLLILAILA
jgi:hypothetical protein